MLPKFEAAADLIRDELAPFRKYDRQPYVKVSQKNNLVWLRVTLKKNCNGGEFQLAERKLHSDAVW